MNTFRLACCIAVIVVGGFVAVCCLIPARTNRSDEED
jgi:hypothetical protein